jgi:predicted SnoaL-like aldol condensation-catalyzing enzyme
LDTDVELDGGRGSAVVDIFRFGPDGKIVEHWDVVRAVAETSANGNTEFDGGGDPTAPTTPEERAANTAVVARWHEILRSGDTAALADVIAAEVIQHNPRAPNGLAVVQRIFGRMGPVELDVYRILAQGDLVLAHYHFKTIKMAGVDIARLADGKIVEMWDVLQELPARTASGHDLFEQLS